MKITLKNQWLWRIGVIVLFSFFIYEGIPYFHKLLFYLQQQQNSLQRTISKMLSTLRQHDNPRAWWGAISFGLLYGILHAIGPGHGKAIISTFLLTQPSGYKSAFKLAVGGALLQGLSAIFWVVMTVGLMQWFIRETVGQVIWAERLSYLFIVAVGSYILWRAYPRKSHHEHCQCGHHHHPHPSSTQQSHLLALLAIGIRPCSGSILALAAAGSWHLWGIGITITLAISCGTAITVLILGLLIVYGREKVAFHLSSRRTLWQKGFRLVAMAGAVILIVLGIMLFITSFSAPTVGIFRA